MPIAQTRKPITRNCRIANTIAAGLLVCIPISGALAQTREGLFIGLDYNTVSASNPYVSISNNQLNESEDSTDYLYIHFGWSAYSPDGYAEFSTNALNVLLGFAYGYIVKGESTYEQYFEDAEADTPFHTRYDNSPEKRFIEQDLFRYALSGQVAEALPLQLGFQGGVGNRGTLSQSGRGQNTNDVDFNEEGVAYWGASVGLGTSINGGLLQANVEYDWNYFLQTAAMNGNTITGRFNYFPFNNRHDWAGLHVKALHRIGNHDYNKAVVADYSPRYEYARTAFGFGYLF